MDPNNAISGGLGSLPVSAQGFDQSRIQQLRANNFDFEKTFRANATTLRKDEWRQIDEAILDVARDMMSGITDLISAGLGINNGGLGTLVHEYERVSDMGGATISLSPSMGPNDAVLFDITGVPVPIIHKGYQINARQLASSQRRGEALDTTHARVSARKVSESQEDMLFNGNTAIKAQGYTIYGYRTHPQRNTGTGEGWGDPANIYATVLAMISAAEADNHFGPYVLYVNKAQIAQTREYVNTTSLVTGMDLIKRLPQITAVRQSLSMPAGEAILVELKNDVVDLSIGQAITNLEWVQYPMVNHYLVMCAMAPRIKSDYLNQSGIVHFTGL